MVELCQKGLDGLGIPREWEDKRCDPNFKRKVMQ